MRDFLIYCDLHLYDNPYFKETDTTSDIGGFLSASAHQKFACLASWSTESLRNNLEKFKMMYTQVEHTFIYSSEFYYTDTELLKEFDRPNVTIFCPKLHWGFKHAEQIPWHFWLGDTIRIYRDHVHNWFDGYDPYTVKPKMFDVLLGHQRVWRDRFYNKVISSVDLEQLILTYQKQGDSISDGNSSSWVCLDPRLKWLQDQAYDSSHAVTDPLFLGSPYLKFNLSQFADIGIYNQTAYSVVHETNVDNSFTWFTEKIAKPLLSRRLFLVLSNQYYLRDLRELGFRTFNGIVDESYDVEPDLNLRYDMVVEQMNFLIQQDQRQILEQIKPIVEHNYNLAQSIKYDGDVVTFINQFKFLG